MHPLETLVVLNEHETVRQRLTKKRRSRTMLYNVGPHKEVQADAYGKGDMVLTCKRCQRMVSSVEIMAASTCKINHPKPPGWAATTH
jgi:hypothetical protein